VVIPQGHDEHNTIFSNSVINFTHSTLLDEICSILRGCNPVFAEIIRDAVMLVSIDFVLAVLDGLAILRVELPNCIDFARISAIISDELCGHRDWLLGVDFEIRPWTPQFLIQAGNPSGLHVTAILVADTLETICTVVTTVSA